MHASTPSTRSSTQAHNSRLGLVLFFIYLAFYAGFVLLAAFSPETMKRTPLAGVNLAIWYGFALIAAAFILALLYGALCRKSLSLEGMGPAEHGRPDVARAQGGSSPQRGQGRD